MTAGTGRLEVQYTGTDGSVWDLRRIAPDGASVFLTNQGLQGLRSADFDYFTREGALTPGQVLTGTRALARKVFLPLLIGVNLDALAFLALNDRWNAANAIGEYGVLRVTRPDGLWRELSIRFNDDGGSALDADPVEEGSDVVGWTYYADDPYWYGPPTPYSFTNAAAANFFNQDDPTLPGATPFIIAPSFVAATATIANAGDVPAWLAYTLYGPIDSFLLNLGGGLVGSVPIPAGARLDIYTDPLRQYAILTAADGTVSDITPLLPSIDWRPVPRGASVPLQISLQGAGRLELVTRPRFYRGY